MKKRLTCGLLCVSMIASLGVSAFAEDATETGDQKYAGEKLTVLYMSGVYADAANSIKDEFEAATGAEVEVIDMPYSELHEKILLDLTSQTGTYDVIDVASQWDGEFAP